MKQKNLLTRMLLLFALVVGSVTSVWGETKPWSGSDPSSTLDLATITSSNLGTWVDETSWFLSDEYFIVSGYASSKSVKNQTWITHANVGSSNNTWDEYSPFQGSSYYTSASYATIQSGRYLLYKVRNMKSFKVYGKNNSTSKYLDIFVYTKSGDNYTKIEEIKYTADNNNHIWEGSSTLDPSETYYIYITGVGNSNSRVFEVAFERNFTKHTLSSAVFPDNTGTVTLGSTSVAEGTSTIIKAEPKSGYYFKNWTVEGAGSSVASATDSETTFTMGTDNAIVTANFAEINYWVVTYDFNDGETANEEVQVLKSEASTYALKAAPSRDKYIFKGWKIGNDTYDAGALYQPVADVTATAQWEFDGVQITYKKAGKNEIATGAKYILIADKSGVKHFAVPSELGSKHQFFDSSTPSNDESEITEEKAVFVDEEPLVLTLEETEDGWYLKNSVGDKLGMSGDKKMSWNDGDMTWILGFVDNVPTFKASYGTSDYTLYYNSSATRFNGYTTKGSNVYAYYYRMDNGKNIYSLTLNFNDGETTDGVHRVLEGAIYTLSTPARDGYVFAGWNTLEDGTGTNYEAGEYTMPTENTTLYAQWSSDVTITPAKQYVSFCSPYALDFTESGLTAYVVSDETESSVNLKQVNKVPANTGLVLKGTANTDYIIPVLNGDADSFTNKLKATGTEGVTVDANSVYVLSDGQFKLYTGTTIAGGKAYLPTAPTASGAPALSLEFGDGTTGIESLTPTLSQGEGVYYDLSGRHVAQPTKGLYIVNGKKVILK